MAAQSVVWLLLAAAFAAANLPWLTERFFFFFAPPGERKRVWMRLLEWLVLLLTIGLIAVGLEYKLTGGRYPQGWEFYAVGLCLFVVFALPGFIYRHDLKKLLARR